MSTVNWRSLLLFVPKTILDLPWVVVPEVSGVRLLLNELLKDDNVLLGITSVIGIGRITLLTPIQPFSKIEDYILGVRLYI
jgi:hypothetical protein